MKRRFYTQGICCKAFDVEVEDGQVKSVKYYGGCSGNGQGISSLVVGMSVDDVISRLKGINCGGKGTSCPDQLACALENFERGEMVKES